MQLLQFVDSARAVAVTPYELEIDVPSDLLEQEPKPSHVVSKTEIPGIEATELQLSNGVRLIYKEAVSSNNRVNISAYKKGGRYALDPSDYVSGNFSASVIALSGAGDLSRDELSYFLAGNSASVRLLIEDTRAGLVGSSSYDAETLFQLLHLKWTRREQRGTFLI